MSTDVIEVAKLPVALTIAGSDSGGGAGIQADLKTFQAFRCFGTSAITAITAQNTKAVTAVQGINPEVVAAQLNAVLDDFPVAAAKTGMLFSVEIISVIADVWRSRGKSIPLIVDPVMVASTGTRLLQADAETALSEFLRLSQLITPNLPEAEILLGHAINGESGMKEAALELYEKYGTAVLVKGGHRLGLDKYVLDVLYDGVKFLTFTSDRLPEKNTHGTGCTLSAAITANLAKGLGLNEAVASARDYLVGAIRNAPNLGAGFGPLNHLWQDL